MSKNVLNFLTAIIFLSLWSCDNDPEDSIPPVDPTPTEKQTGFVVHTQAGTGNELTNFVQFFDAIPCGSIDNTEGKAFQTFFVSQVIDNFIITGNISGADEGLSQVNFDLNGEAFESAFLPTTGFAGFGGF